MFKFGKKKKYIYVCYRDNPCPHLGNIVTIKLSENQENVPQTDNTYLTMIVETHFQVGNSVQKCFLSFFCR